jgi:O-acetyl-ADP-ribose deacetylase (regulator of RNase III)
METMMSNHERQPVIEVVVGDITKFAADVIVNSAHESLAPGGGVSGAIHKAAGPELAAECAEIVESRGWLEAGEVAITKAYNLPAKFVVHAVAPRFADLGLSCHVQLSMAYSRAIDEAGKVGAKTIVFPSLGTGIFGFPIESAPLYALDGIRAGLGSNPSIEKVTICCFSDGDAFAYKHVLQLLG